MPQLAKSNIKIFLTRYLYIDILWGWLHGNSKCCIWVNWNVVKCRKYITLMQPLKSGKDNSSVISPYNNIQNVRCSYITITTRCHSQHVKFGRLVSGLMLQTMTIYSIKLRSTGPLTSLLYLMHGELKMGWGWFLSRGSLTSARQWSSWRDHIVTWVWKNQLLVAAFLHLH